MTIEEFISILESFVVKLPEITERNLELSLLDTKALIQQRIQEKGQDSSESAFSPYATEYLRRKKKANRYRGIVDMTGLPPNGGEMFKSLGIVTRKVSGDKVEVVLGGRDQFTNDKLEWNSKLRGDLLQTSKKETEFLTNSFEERMQDDTNNFFSRQT